MSSTQKTVRPKRNATNRLASTAVADFTPGAFQLDEGQPSRQSAEFAARLVSLTARLVNTTSINLDTHIRQTLADLGHLSAAEGCYLFRFSDDGSRVLREHVWGRGEALPFFGYTGFGIDRLPLAVTRLRWHERNHRMPEGAPDDILTERTRLNDEFGIQSLINIPLVSSEGPIGALGLTTSGPTLGMEEDAIGLLKILGHVISEALARVRLEARIQSRKTSIERIIKGLEQVMYRLSIPEGRCLYMGEAAESVFGYTATDFKEHPLLIRKIMHPEFLDAFDAEWTRIVGGEVSESHEYKVIAPDGEERWIHQSNHIIMGDREQPVAIEGICRNITKQKSAESILRSSEERFRAITENAADIILIMSQEGRLTYIAPSMERELGYNPADILSMSFEEFVHPDDLELAWNNFRESLSQPGETLRIPDLRVRHLDGSWRWLDGLLTNLLHKPSVDGLVLNCRDITRRKNAEEESLRAKEFLEDRVDERTRELAEANARLTVKRDALAKRTVALKEVLGQVEAARTELATQTQANVDKIALPILDILERTGAGSEEHYIRLLRSCLKDITAPLSHYLDRTFPELTYREQEICHMVKDGFSCKDIAATLHVSVQTVLKQRKTIRRKLGLAKRKINLASYLRSVG